MKQPILSLLAGLFATSSVGAQILSVDINERGQNEAATTQAGFSSFVMQSANGSTTAAQTNATTRTFGDYTVTISGNGSNPIYDDRVRNVPVNGGAFSQSLLLRDFIFSGSTAAGGGLNLLVEGLSPGQIYQVTIWSYDNSSTGLRVSDWSANGVLVRENYAFNGAVLPVTDDDYKFTFKIAASPAGQLLVEGRRDAATGANPGVFLNAFQLEETVPDAPSFVREPQPVQAYVGEVAVFTTEVQGTAPFQFQWFRNGETIADATNQTLTVPAVTAADAVGFSVRVANSSGEVISDEAPLTVIPVQIDTALVAYWRMDDITDLVRDETPNHNDLNPVNMDISNLVDGYQDDALSFNGTDEFLVRQDDVGVDLPIYTARKAYTVAMWVRGIGAGQVDHRVFSEASTTNLNPLLNIGTHNLGTDGTVDIYIRTTTGAALVDHRHSSQVAFDGQWHHVTLVDDEGRVRLYVDSVLDNTDFNYSRAPLLPNDTSIGGIQLTNASHWFAGAIDEVILWKRALSGIEVQYAMTHGPIPPTPLQITKLEIVDGSVSLLLTTPDSNAIHHVRATADLINGPWTAVEDVTQDTLSPGTVRLQFPLPGGSVQFFRVDL